MDETTSEPISIPTIPTSDDLFSIPDLDSTDGDESFCACPGETSTADGSPAASLLKRPKPAQDGATLSDDEYGTEFIDYMGFLTECKYTVPVMRSVKHLIDKKNGHLGDGAVATVYKGMWVGKTAAFKHIRDANVPSRNNLRFPETEESRKRMNLYKSALQSLMFEIKIMAKVLLKNPLKL
jgi:hypothetical protein